MYVNMYYTVFSYLRKRRDEGLEAWVHNLHFKYENR